VRDTVYWAIHADEIVGRISLRHELNDFLAKAGGHIGYIVRPSWRGQGVATDMLRQVLKTERAKSIGKLLLTCDDDNAASKRTIIKNGGVLESALDVAPGESKTRRFWIFVT
jgi:predicted acetyltransferase